MSGGQLTWKNVDAPNFSGGNDAYRTAAFLLSKASAPVQEAMAQYQAEDRLRQSAIAQANVLTSANPMTALQSGTALAGIDTGMLSQDAINNMGMEAQRRANVGNTLASTANTRATTERINTLTPLEAQGKQIDNNYATQINPIRVDTARTGAEVARLELQKAQDGFAIQDRARNRVQMAAQQGLLASDEGKEDFLRSLDANGVDIRERDAARTMLAGTAPALKGNVDSFLLGRTSPGGNPVGSKANPFDNGGDSLSLATGLIKKKEGYDPNGRGGIPYWDVNAYRGGYGSDTLTNPVTGEFRRVMPGDKITPQMAEADLNRRVSNFQAQAAKEAPGFEKLPAAAQAGLTSVIYNYGSFEKLPNLKAAIASGDVNQIANEVRALKDHNNGVNASRRIEEANIIAGKSQAPVNPNGSPAVTAQKPAPAPYSPLNTAPSNDPVAVLQQARDLSNMAQALVTQNRFQSNIFDKDASIAKAFASEDNSKPTIEIINDIVKKGENSKDDPGFKWFSNTATSRTGITNAMNYLIKEYNISPLAAGAIIENNVTSVNKWFTNDYQSVETSQLDDFMKQYTGGNSKRIKQEFLNKGLSLVNADKNNAEIASKVQIYENIQSGLRDSLATAMRVNDEYKTKETAEAVNKAREKLADNINSMRADLRKLQETSKMNDKTRQRQ